MNKINLNNIFSDSDCLPEQKLLDYKKNKLSSKEKHLVEKHIANCDFCADALEGISLIKSPNKIKKSLNEINKAINKHINYKKPQIVTFSLSTKFAIAATIAIFITISFMFTQFLKNNSQNALKNNNLAITNFKEKKSNITPEINQTEDLRDLQPIEKSYFVKSMQTDNTSKSILNPKTYTVSDNLSIQLKEDINTREYNEDKTIKMVTPEIPKNDPIVKEELLENEKPETKTITDFDDLESGSNFKNDETNIGGVSKKENTKKNKIIKIEDIVSNKRNESKAPSAPSTQGSSIMQEVAFNQALEKFNQKDYVAAKQFFEQILINNATNIAAIYYKSLCCFYLDEIDNSILGFNKILKSEKNEYYQDAQWYKALALIKKGNKKEAKKILLNLIKSNGLYKLNAEQKIKEI